MTDQPEFDLPPRRIGPRAIVVTSTVLAIAGAMALPVARDDTEPTARAAPDALGGDIVAAPVDPKIPEEPKPAPAGSVDPETAGRHAGIVDALQQESGHFLASPYGGAYAVGEDDDSVWGGLVAEESGGGLGGLGYGQGFGRGQGHGFGGRGHMVMPNLRRLSESGAGDGYDAPDEHRFVSVVDDARSTFSIDVDTASYTNVRRFLLASQLPPPDAVRVEEFVNYFDYEYDPPTGAEPFAVESEVVECPWNPGNLLVRLGLQGQVYDHADLPARNFVFLVDASGSMAGNDRLPLVRSALELLVDDMRPQDRVGIVAYAGASGVVLEPTTGADKATIRRALAKLRTVGSTHGSAGIEQAYRLASRHFVEGGANRVILATDGDFNVGATSRNALIALIERKRASGVFLSVLGVGRGNLQDATMERLADAGNGNYAYLDSLAEARRVLVDDAAATLVTIAKDVKIQVEFDPSEVASWRLVGYENRKLAHGDFADDTKDAGEIGAGHDVTALYEIVPARAMELRNNPLMTASLRWKAPDGDTSAAMEHTVGSDTRSMAASSDALRLATTAAQFAMLLRGSAERGEATWANTRALADQVVAADPDSERSCQRAELLALIDRAAGLHAGTQGFSLLTQPEAAARRPISAAAVAVLARCRTA